MCQGRRKVEVKMAVMAGTWSKTKEEVTRFARHDPLDPEGEWAISSSCMRHRPLLHQAVNG